MVPLFGKKITLNELEHGIIRKQYHDPRVHMALVCAAKGCPILRSEAYTAEKLDGQLDDQSRRYLATPAGLVVDRKKGVASISAIFKWYGKDFTGAYAGRIKQGSFSNSERGSLGFVSGHVSKVDESYILRGDYRLRTLIYDWSLNDSAEGTR